MYLKRLTVHGFKSFADRTTFDFESGGGLTCIVGPNGCGKSNVFEAVRWVLGEQRPTSLRSRELTDVIFNGTIRRPPMGLCEGTLTFDNASGTLPLDATEVAVTRRVFRTGETDYQINGAPVRLKDIRDLFAGTGLGAGGYAFMEQGKIDQVLAANPLERRKVFEEAAGISRFRTRRREAELKLNRVEENLIRLHDIVEEISRQIRSLKIHAGKARNFREMEARVRDLQLRFSIHRYEEIRADQASLAAAVAEVSEERGGREANREQLREAMRAIEHELEHVIEGVSNLRTRCAEVGGRMATSKGKLEFQTTYHGELTRRLGQRHEEMEGLQGSLARLDEERIVVIRDREALEQDKERIQRDVARHESAMAALAGIGTELERERVAAETYLRDLEQRASRLASEEARTEADLGHLESRLENHRAARLRVDEESAVLGANLEELAGRQDAQTSALENRRGALTEEERAAEDLERGFSESVDELRRREADLGRARARHEVLAGLLSKGEGLEEGTRALVDERRRNPDFLPGARGLLYDLFDVELAYARAVEAALGPAADALVVADLAEAQAGLGWLRDQGMGGARFLPLDRFSGAATEDEDLPGIRAKDPDVAPVLLALLRGLDVVTTSELDQRLVEGTDLGRLVVSVAGETVRDGRAVAATPAGPEHEGLVVLQSELRHLDVRLPGLVAARDEGRQLLDQVRASRDASRARIKELSVALVSEEGEAARLDQTIVRILRERDRLKEERARLVEAISGLETRQGESQDALQTLRDSRDALATDMEKAAAAREEHTARRAEHEAARREAGAVLESVRIEAAQSQERAQSLQGRQLHLESSLEDIRRRLVAGEQDRAEFEDGLRLAAQVIEEEREALEHLEVERNALQETLREHEGTAEGVRERLRGTAQELDRVEGTLAALTERLAAFRGREGELKASLESLLARAREEMDLDLEDPAARAITVVVSEEPEEAVDWKAVEREIRDLRDRMARLGNVNLAAVEELDEAEKRADFIFRERDDLLSSKEQLKKILKEIEAQSTEMFVTTFNNVREHFSATFRKLFGGGKAEITLEDESLPLESGIEIKARPPGKEFRSIALLSGGERTMTAVALLFAIFRANPAPCAFLDEVDAALDEDNTDRFCVMLEEFCAQSQFVVVTHSKRTMERGSLIYGVTMPERGVSRRVAVRLEQVDEQGRIRDLAAVNRDAATASQHPDDEPAQTAADAEPLDTRPRSLEAPALARRAPPPPTDETAAS